MWIKGNDPGPEVSSAQVVGHRRETPVNVREQAGDGLHTIPSTLGFNVVLVLPQ